MSALDPLSDKVQANVHLARPSNRAKTELWLKDLGVRFVDVWFFSPGADPQWVLAPQVDDPETLGECIRQELGRSGAGAALWRQESIWYLHSRYPGVTKAYPSREAAEMVAIHRG